MFYDPSAKIEGSDFSPLPKADYSLKVEETNVGPNKAGTGQRVKVTFSVQDKPYTGRKIWHNFNIKHTNAQAENIGKAELKEFLDAVGVKKALATEGDFHNAVRGRSVMAELEVDGKFNRVAKFFPVFVDAKRAPAAKAPTEVDDDTVPF